jgi:hypothetical protein
MAEAEERMFPEHAWAGVAHDDADLFAAIFLVAMHGALGARGLFGAEPAAIQSQAGVIEEALAFGARFAVVMIAAVEADHGFDRAPFAGEAFAGLAG